MRKAIPCPCGDKVCKNWLVDPEAALQGVKFTEEQARAVVHLLDKLDAVSTGDSNKVPCPECGGRTVIRRIVIVFPARGPGRKWVKRQCVVCKDEFEWNVKWAPSVVEARGRGVEGSNERGRKNQKSTVV